MASITSILTVLALCGSLVQGQRLFADGPRLGRQLKYAGFGGSGPYASVQVTRNVNDGQIAALTKFIQRPNRLDPMDSSSVFFQYNEEPYDQDGTATLLADEPIMYDVTDQAVRTDGGSMVQQCGVCSARQPHRTNFPADSPNWGPFCDQIWDAYTGVDNKMAGRAPPAVALYYYDNSNGPDQPEACSVVALESFVSLPHTNGDSAYGFLNSTCHNGWSDLQSACPCGDPKAPFAGGLRVAFNQQTPWWRFSIIPNGPGCEVPDDNRD